MIRSYISSSFCENGKRRHYYSVYTIVFLTVAFFCFSWFIFSGRSLIWESDGWTQHFKALVYYAQYLRTIVKNLLFQHKLIIPDWDFNIGEGSDIVNALHYYVIGDPITLFSVFVPTKLMHYFYSASCILRLYLAGIAFSELCFGTFQKNRYAIMTGSVAYCFCTWAVLNAARHPYFLNPMIYFPFLILGMEKIIRKEKPYIFIAAVTVSAASNFYFFYMIVVLAVIYAVIRIALIYKRQVKDAVLMLLRLGVMAVTGVCIAGIILIPVLMMFLGDSRLSVSQPFHLFYSMGYYTALPSVLTSKSGAYWLCMGYAAPVILSVFILFFKKKSDVFLKALICISVLIILFPIGGRLLNGMSYMTNRWTWALALLCTYILVKKWDGLLSLSRRKWTALVIITFCYYVLCFIVEKSRVTSAFVAVPMFLIVLIIARNDLIKFRSPAIRQALILLLVGVNVVSIAFWRFSPEADNYVKAFKENSKVFDELSNNEATAIKNYTDDSYTRITGKSLTYNANVIKEISSTQYYWSISNSHINKFRCDLEMREPQFFRYLGYDDRSTVLSLSSVLYYFVKSSEKATLPYGFSFFRSVKTDPTLQKNIENLKRELGVENLTSEQISKLYNTTKNEYYIYKNDNALPLTYTYDSYLTNDVWDSYNPVQRQEKQLEAAFVDKKIKSISVADDSSPDYLVPYDIECQGTEISKDGNKIITTCDNAKITLKLNKDVTAAETYVGFEGLEFVPTAEYDLYFGSDSVDPLKLYNKTNWRILSKGKQTSIKKEKFYWDKIQDAYISVESSNGASNTINYMQPDSTFSSGRHDFIANLGYSEKPVSYITVKFAQKGVYTFSDLSVYAIPMNGFAEKITALKEDTLQNMKLGTDSMSGTITLSKAKILCFATPYSSGWKACIDGKETEVYCLNERYPGIVIEKGYHTVEFKYQMPYKKAGFIVSVIGILGLAAIIFFDAKKVRLKK